MIHCNKEENEELYKEWWKISTFQFIAWVHNFVADFKQLRSDPEGANEQDYPAPAMQCATRLSHPGRLKQNNILKFRK